jgi:hypothetical protein
MKPIIMSTEDVRATLDGWKTMTRMPIKHQPDKSAQFMRISCGRACFETDTDMWNIMLPYKPGDVLWVRETWELMTPKQNEGPDFYLHRADGLECESNPWFSAWRSPVTMPREAARLFLRVKDVRVERVQDISPEDCESEGYFEAEPVEPRPRSWFSAVWDARNAKRGYGWDSNPFVWVISFERLE